MRMITIAALAAFSLSVHAIEYTPDPNVAFDIIQMHDTTTWEKVCESYDGVCDVLEGTYQVKLLDRNWKELVRLRDVNVQHSSSQGPAGADDTLANLPCTTNQIARYDGSDWVCSDDPLVDVLDPTILDILMRLESLESSPVYRIGDTGPGGGIVFHVTNGGLNGLEAAQEDQDVAQWCSHRDNVAGVDDISTDEDDLLPDSHSGEHNTPLIEAVCGASSAAGVAAAYEWPDGQRIGFLPNKDELNLLFIMKDVVGGFDSGLGYWSSSEGFLSEGDIDFAWGGTFRTPTIRLMLITKAVIAGVRAVRAF